MGITLRNIKGSELTWSEVDENFSSLYYSSSINKIGPIVTFFFTGSNYTSPHTIDFTDVTFVSKSVSDLTGSNSFGSICSDTQIFTGSLLVSGCSPHHIIGSNVGIGTKTPAAKLDVRGSIVSDGSSSVITGSFSGSLTGGDISVDNAVVNGNLDVHGTASFTHTTNLDIADRFVRLASGSSTGGDGGIVVQQNSPTNGEAFGFESGSVTRWGFTSSFNASQNSYTPDAFAAAVIDISAGHSDSTRYQKNGNIKIESGEIYIYA